MKLKEVLNIPGMSGLFKMVAQSKSGVIVESLIDGKRQPIGTMHRVVPLTDIKIFTAGDELPLVEVFKKMEADLATGAATVDSKAEQQAMKEYFKKLVPDIDEEKVHLSHMKKMLLWYELLKGKIDFNAKEEEGAEGENPILQEGQEKPVAQKHEGHIPKADQHAKRTTAKLRKKV
jgi:hypothetical protein